MRRIFATLVLTMFVGMTFVSAVMVLHSAYGQLRLPPGEVSILNGTAANNTQSNSTNNTTAPS
jgi:hypothetical protein